MSASFRSEVDTCKWASAVGREEEALAKRRGGTQMKGSEANGPFAVAGAQPYEARARPQHKLSHSNLKFPLAAERQETMALSIFVPIGYVATLVVSMLVFSRIYRRRSALNLAKSYQPWFPEGHEARDIYQTLVAADPPAPEEVLKAALLNRAMTDVRRIMRMRDDKQALGTLLQKGSIGDETMARFTLAEKELEAEILDVVSEANTFREGWGQLIFPSASEMVAHLKHKEIYYEIQRQRAAEVKKLEDEGKPVPKANVELPPLITPPGTKIEIPGGPGGPGGPMPAPPQGGPGPNGPGISLPMTGSGQDARVTLPNGMQLHPAQLQALMQGPLPPNMPPQQAAMLMEARAQLLALQEQAQAQAQAQAQQQQQQQPADANKENDQTPAAAPTEAKAETPAATSTKTATVEDGDDA